MHPGILSDDECDAWYIPAQRKAAHVDRNGNIGPTIWCDGHVVGAWVEHTRGHIIYRLFADAGPANIVAIEKLAARLSEWIGGTRFRPRFHTPLELDLADDGRWWATRAVHIGRFGRGGSVNVRRSGNFRYRGWVI